MRLTNLTAGLGLRSSTDADRSFLISLYAAGRAAEIESWGWTDSQKNQFIDLQYSARSSQYNSVYPDRDDQIVLLGDLPVGFISVARSDSRIYLVDIALLPEYQGRGLGKALLKALQQQACESGLPLLLHVFAENESAAIFYDRLGFVCVENDNSVYRLFEWRPDSCR